MKKLLTILLVLISFSSFAQFEAGEYINSDTVKIDGVPLLLNTFLKDSLGGAGNIFYSTGAISQPASGTVNQVVGGNLLTANYLPKWDGSKLANSTVTESGGKVGINRQNPSFFDLSTECNGTIATTRLRLQESYLDNGFFGVQLRAYDNGIDGHNFVIEGRNSALGNFTPYFFMRNTGYFGINTTLPSERLDVNGNLIADVLKSRVATGTPPLVVASSTKVDSLNVGLLDGKKASDFQLKSDTTTFDATKKELIDSSAAIRSLANTKAVVSGTDNYIMKKTGANTLGNSFLFQDASFLKTDVDLKIGKVAPAFYLKDSHSNYSGFLYVYDSIFGIQKRDYATDAIISAPYGFSLDAPTNTIFTNNLGNTAFGHSSPLAKLHPISTTTQARFGYDANKYTDLSTGSTGNLTIDPTGDTVKVVGAVNSTGGFFKNGVEITGGTGSMVYPLNSGIVTYNGTTWGTSITNNSYLWNHAYDKKIVSAAFSGTSTKTLTLYQQDGNVLQASFTDQSGGAGNWSTDTYGLYYDAGQVGIGTNSVSNTWLTVGSGSSSKNGVYAYSGTNAAVHGVSGYIGVFGESPDGYGVYGVSGTSYGGVFDRGVNIASGNLDIQGQTRISQSGFFQPVSSSDAAAPNNSIYYSTTQSKLVYKNASGTVNVLY